MFKLLRHFSLTSAVAILSVTVVLCVLYRQNAVNELVELAETQNVVLARSFANTIWPRFSTYVTGVSGLDGDALRARPETRQIHEALKALSAGLPVLKVKIYNLDGLTVFSSQASQIGEDKSNNPGFFAAAREGRAGSKLAHKERFTTFSGEASDRHLVESYLPIRRGDGPIEGVFELYSDVTPIIARIERFTPRLAAGLLLVFGLLYAVLFLIVRRADRILKRQYVDVLRGEQTLQEANERLEQRVEERTGTLTREIAERKRAEEELRASEERYRRIYENTPVMLHSIDKDGRLLSVSDHWLEVLGYGRDEVIGQKVMTFMVEESARDMSIPRLPEFIKTGRTTDLPLKFVKKNGEVIDVLLSAVAERDEAGEFVRSLTVLTDITKRKRAEAALRESEERFKDVAEAASDWFWEMDGNLCVRLG